MLTIMDHDMGVPMADWLEFENDVELLLRRMGFHTESTERSADGGIDIIAMSDKPLASGKYIIQCKAWSKPVGVQPVRDLYGVVNAENANKGILITTSTFTSAAIRFAEDKPLELVDGDQYQRLREQFGFGTGQEDSERRDVDHSVDGLVRLLSVRVTDRQEDAEYRTMLHRWGRLDLSPTAFSFEVRKELLPSEYEGMTLVELNGIHYVETGWKAGDTEGDGDAAGVLRLKFESSETTYSFEFSFGLNFDLGMQLFRAVDRSLLPHGPASHQSSNSRKDCFIATAIYGAPDHASVEALRRWRDRRLTSWRLGRCVCDLYVRFAPRFIPAVRKSRVVRASIRWFLDILVSKL